MPTIKIDDKDYDMDKLSDEVKDHLLSLQFVDTELQRLNAQIAVFITARNTYSTALKAALPGTAPPVGAAKPLQQAQPIQTLDPTDTPTQAMAKVEVPTIPLTAKK